MARRRRSRSLKGLGFIAGMSGTQFVIGAAIGAVAMHFYMKKKDVIGTAVEKAEKAIEKAADAAAVAQDAAATAAGAASTAVNGLGAMSRYSRSRSNRCVPSLCAQGLTVYCC